MEEHQDMTDAKIEDSANNEMDTKSKIKISTEGTLVDECDETDGNIGSSTSDCSPSPSLVHNEPPTTQRRVNVEPSRHGDRVNLYRYNMNHRERGMAVVINNRTFHGPKPLSARDGTDEDAEDLRRVFKNLGFHVQLFKDLKASDIRGRMHELASKDHSDHDAFVCVILSHGCEGKIYGADGETLQTDELFAPFKGDKCKSLAGKPKLFFIQACRGDRKDCGVEMADSSDPGSLDGPQDTLKDMTDVTQRIPVEADFLVAYSVSAGYLCWRNRHGSWFIQALCHVLSEHGTTLEILQIMTRVNRRVAYEYGPNKSVEMSGMKQCPSMVSTLTRELYFHPKYIITDPTKDRKRRGLSVYAKIIGMIVVVPMTSILLLNLYRVISRNMWKITIIQWWLI